MRSRLGAILLLVLVAWPREAAAYRPFDGTDADVAALFELELEMGPIGYFRYGPRHDFVTGGVINFGFAPRFEFVLQGFDFYPLDKIGGDLNRFTDTGAFVKVVLKEGCLQEKPGPSVATEDGPLLPTVNDSKGFGAYAGGIVSTCIGDSLIIHWNLELQILRQTQDFDVFTGAILEPKPSKSALRPVVELYTEHDFGGLQTYSGLVGAIWVVSEKLALDAALREALVGGVGVSEVRAGFSWAIP